MLRTILSNWLAAADRALKLVLWVQLPRRGLSGLLVHLYAAPWLAALIVLALSASLLLLPANSSGESAGLALVSFCPILAIFAYVLARCLPLATAALAVLIPATLTISPSVGSVALPEFAGDPEARHYLGTGDLAQVFIGAMVCVCLSAISFGLQALAQLPRRRRWPFRWAAAVTILGSGLVGLETLRCALNLAPGLPLPWSRPLMWLMSGSGWPYALVVWLWANTAYLLARYDAKLIPYLLRRANIWAPGELSIHETYLIDELLDELEQAHVEQKGRRRALPQSRAKGKNRSAPERDR